MVPSVNHLMTRENTSPGVEKKNGGSTFVAVSTCHRPIVRIATRVCSTTRFTRERLKSSSAGLGVALEHFGFEHVPDLAMELVERRLELDLGDVARAREPDPPLAQDSRGRTGRHDDHAVGERDRLLHIL